ncbi:MAG TPA: hypothetical protein VMW10_00395 [Alphaproteobacteria bacterium]|nr:hypothetical protein [Alphaproteobacteria bacterium]
MSKEKMGLAEYAQKYVRIKKGTEFRSLREHELELLRMIETAQKKNCTLHEICARGNWRWVMVKDEEMPIENG